MPRKTKKVWVPDDRKGSKCTVCGQVFTMPTGYSYPYYSDLSYEVQDHPSIVDCVKYLRKELEDAKVELQDYKDRVRDLERNSRYDEYH